MPVEIGLTKKSIKDLRAIQRRMNPKVFLREILEFFDRQASIGADFIGDEYASGQRLKRRSGNLARSIIGRSLAVGKVPAMRIGVLRGPALRYAGVQEYGTKGKNPSSPYPTIRPKSAKALAVPIGPALTPAGVARKPGPEDWDNLAFVPFRGNKITVGGLYDVNSLHRAGGNLRKAKAYYLLMTQVDIEPKWYLRDGFDAWLPELADNLADYLRDVLVGLKARS